jgi:hypothetical protein
MHDLVAKGININGRTSSNVQVNALSSTTGLTAGSSVTLGTTSSGCQEGGTCVTAALGGGFTTGNVFYQNMGSTQNWGTTPIFSVWIQASSTVAQGVLQLQVSSTNGLANVHTAINLPNLSSGVWTLVSLYDPAWYPHWNANILSWGVVAVGSPGTVTLSVQDAEVGTPGSSIAVTGNSIKRVGSIGIQVQAPMNGVNVSGNMVDDPGYTSSWPTGVAYACLEAENYNGGVLSGLKLIGNDCTATPGSVPSGSNLNGIAFLTADSSHLITGYVVEHNTADAHYNSFFTIPTDRSAQGTASENINGANLVNGLTWQQNSTLNYNFVAGATTNQSMKLNWCGYLGCNSHQLWGITIGTDNSWDLYENASSASRLHFNSQGSTYLKLGAVGSSSYQFKFEDSASTQWAFIDGTGKIAGYNLSNCTSGFVYCSVQSFAGTAARSIVWPDASGTVALVGSTGSVTSVGGDGIVDAATPTITGSGALTPIQQSANTVLAGPASGSAANPSFRALVSADIPNNGANITGTSGGLTGSPTISVNQVIATSPSAITSANCLAATSVSTPCVAYQGAFYGASCIGSQSTTTLTIASCSAGRLSSEPPSHAAVARPKKLQDLGLAPVALEPIRSQYRKPSLPQLR